MGLKSKALMDQMSNTTDLDELEKLKVQYIASLKEEALSSEGELYAGKNNAAAMRAGEDAKAKLGQAKKETRIALPGDFPIAWEPQIVEMIRRKTGNKAYPDRATIVAFWEGHKNEIDVEPSRVPKHGKSKTIPEAVEFLFQKRDKAAD